MSCSIRRESTTSTHRGSHDTATSLIAFGKSTITLVTQSFDDWPAATASPLQSNHTPLSPRGRGAGGEGGMRIRFFNPIVIADRQRIALAMTS